MIQNMSQAVLLLILANVLFSMKGFGDQVFFEKFKFQVAKILQGEKIRMISSGFLHVDWMHLGFNMYALYLFGDIVDAKLGTIGFFPVDGLRAKLGFALSLDALYSTGGL